MRTDTLVQELTSEYKEVFSEKLGCLKDFKVSIPVATDADYKFFKSRPVPYALRGRVEEELNK